jgi:hypothetical protein
MQDDTTAVAAVDDFAQPIYSDTGSAEAGAVGTDNAASNGQADPADIPMFDPNDPALLLQEMDTAQGEDPYKQLPPLPDGRWLVKVKQMDVKGLDGQPARYAVKRDKQTGAAYAYTGLTVTVIDPSGKHDGVELKDYFVSTRTDARKGGANALSWILGCLKVQIPGRMTIGALIDTFCTAVAGEPQLEIESAWEGGLDQATQDLFENSGEKQPRVLGQHRFPQVSRQVPSPVNPAVKVTVTESLPDLKVNTKLGEVNLHARPRINGYYAVGSGKAQGLPYGARAR